MATNFERITESPEELAKVLCGLKSCAGFILLGVCPSGGCSERVPQCEGAALDWLQEEASE